MSLNDWLGRRRLLTPDRVGLVDDETGRRYRYAELDERAARAACDLQRRLGVQPGDRVACLSTNRIEYVDLYFACGKIGAILVPLNTRLPLTAVCELLADCDAKVLVFESQFTEVADAALRQQLAKHVSSFDEAGDWPPPESTARSAKDALDAQAELAPFRADPADIAMILYTSGTTGRPKGAMISYGQIHWNALNTVIGLQLTQEDAALLNMPLYHTGGWHVLFTPLALLGGKTILQKGFDAHRCNQLLGQERVTILFGVPTTLRMMQEADNFADADFSTVRFAIFGGEPCPLPVIQAYSEREVAMRQGYGLTEAGPNCFSLPAVEAIRKSGSIGLPNFLVDVRLRKADGGEAAVGEVGELLMKGPHLFKGYWRDPQATAEALPDGWLATGDLMTRDAEGCYYVVGRKKEMYVSGGENVYPAQVERVLQMHDAVALAAVIGVADPRWGETGWAFVQEAPGASISEALLIDWCRQRLARFQCPARIHFLEQLPMGPSGKIDKRALAERAAAEFGV